MKYWECVVWVIACFVAIAVALFVLGAMLLFIPKPFGAISIGVVLVFFVSWLIWMSER